jgi:hypothetical protein
LCFLNMDSMRKTIPLDAKRAAKRPL